MGQAEVRCVSLRMRAGITKAKGAVCVVCTRVASASILGRDDDRNKESTLRSK